MTLLHSIRGRHSSSSLPHQNKTRISNLLSHIVSVFQTGGLGLSS